MHVRGQPPAAPQTPARRPRDRARQEVFPALFGRRIVHRVNPSRARRHGPHSATAPRVSSATAPVPCLRRQRNSARRATGPARRRRVLGVPFCEARCPGHHRVHRGGTWNNTTATNVRAAYRNDNTPTNRNNNIGFRCARARNARVPAATAVGRVHLLPPPGGPRDRPENPSRGRSPGPGALLPERAGRTGPRALFFRRSLRSRFRK